jgi:anti-sigma factor RsiW
MTCREISEFLMAYLDGELPAARTRAFEEHIGGCPECVAYLESYKATVELGKAAFVSEDDRAAELPEQLIDAILRATRAR